MSTGALRQLELTYVSPARLQKLPLCAVCIAEAGSPTDFAADLTMDIAVEQHPL